MEPEVLRLRARVDSLEKRLAEVESRLGLAPAVPPPPVVEETPPPPRVVPPPIPTFVPPAPPEPEIPVAARQTPAESGEAKSSIAWMSWIGAVTMIAAVAWAFLLAVDRGWIQPMGRVMLGLATGAIALFAGEKLWQRRHHVFAQAITVIGIALFYFSFYAAYQLYALVHQIVAFSGAVVTTLVAGAFALRFDARAVALFALFGGYLSPFLASSGQHNDLFFGSYMFVLNAIALTLARRKRWFSVEIFAAVGTLLLFAFWMAEGYRRITPIEGGLFITLQFAVFAWSPFALIRGLAPVPVMAAVGLVCSLYSSPVYWTWAACISLLALVLAWRERDDRWLAPSVLGWAAGFPFWDPDWASHGSLFLGLTAGFLVYLAAIVLLPAVPRTLSTYSALALNGLFYYGACFGWFDEKHHGYMGLLALAVAGCYLAAGLYLKGRGAPQEMLLVSAGLALSFVTLAIPIQFSGFSITLAWAVESAVLAFLAMRFQSRWPFAASWLVAALALNLLFDQDAGRAWGTEYSPLFNARFIPFVVMTLALAANAYWTSRLTFLPSRLAAVPLLAAHFTLLAGLHLEVFAWLKSGAQAGADVTSQLTLASSLLLALYGVVLVAHGISGRFLLHRMLGLALLALVVVKLYAFDIWQLSLVYRILAFAAVGALLLSGSFLYSRYRHRLLALLQENDETPTA